MELPLQCINSTLTRSVRMLEEKAKRFVSNATFKVRFAITVTLLSSVAIASASESNYQELTTSRLWNNTANWDSGIIPGQGISARGLVDSGEEVHVMTAPNEQIAYDIWVGDTASGGIMNVNANMLLVDSIQVGWLADANGTWLQNAGDVEASSVLVGSNSGAGQADMVLWAGSLLTDYDIEVESTGRLTVIDGAYCSAGADFVMNGELTIKVGETGFYPIEVLAQLVIGSGAKLNIHLDDYVAGPLTFDLITFASKMGSFDPSNITVTGLDAGESYSLGYDNDSMNLTILGTRDPASMVFFSQNTTDIYEDDLVVSDGHFKFDLKAADIVQCNRTEPNGMLLYSITYTNDFDDDGTEEDLTFNLRVKGYWGSSIIYDPNPGGSSVTINTANYTPVTYSSDTWGISGGSQGDCLGLEETLRFSVENVSISDNNYVAEFDGFYAFTLAEPHGGREHKVIIGKGTGLDSIQNNFEKTFTFDRTDMLWLTSAGSFSANITCSIANVRFAFKVRPDPAPSSSVWDVEDYSTFSTGPDYGDGYSAQVSNSDFPSHSWNSVPLWASIRKNSAITDAEINAIAENYYAIDSGSENEFDTRIEGMLDTAERLHDTGEEIKFYFYWNTRIHYDGHDDPDGYPLDDSWSVWGPNPTTGVPEVQYIRNDIEWYNHDIEAMRDWWLDTALDMLSYSDIDGIFIDKVAPDLDDGVISGSNYMDMLMELYQSMPSGKTVIGNSLRNERPGGNRETLDLMDGSYLERWDFPKVGQSKPEAVAVSMQLMREALSKGKMILLNAHPGGDPSNAAEMEAAADYYLALFLIIAEKHAYLRYQKTNLIGSGNEWEWETSYIQAFQNWLGEPLGAPTRDGYIYERSYPGVDVSVNLETETAVLDWHTFVELAADDFDGNNSFESTANSSPRNTTGITFDSVSRATVQGSYLIDTSVTAGGVVALNPADTKGILEEDKIDHVFGLYRAGAGQVRTLTYTVDSVDLAGYENIILKVDIAASGDNAASKDIKIRWKTGAGSYQDVIAIGSSTTDFVETFDDGRVITNNSNLTTMVNGNADRPLKDIFQTYTAVISSDELTDLQIQIQANSSVGGDCVALDNLRILGVEK